MAYRSLRPQPNERRGGSGRAELAAEGCGLSEPPGGDSRLTGRQSRPSAHQPSRRRSADWPRRRPGGELRLVQAKLPTRRDGAVSAFEIVHQDRVVGKLSCFDRLIFKGHLSGLFPDGAFAYFLHSQDVLLKDFGRYVKQMTEQLKAHATAICEQSGRPYRYLPEA